MATEESQSKGSIHNNFTSDLFADGKFSLDIFRVVFPPAKFNLFNWDTLRAEATVYADTKGSSTADMVFNVKLKRVQKTTAIVFLLEHKSYRDSSVVHQLLKYQAAIYDKKEEKIPIIPILIYQGRSKNWSAPLSFQESLEGMTPTIKKHFGKNILNFECFLLNLQDVQSWERKRLTSNPIFYIMAHIWRMNRQVLDKYIELCLKTKDKKTRKLFLEKGLDYVHSYDQKKFSWKWIGESESKQLDEGERVMPALRSSLDRERERGLKQGLKKGFEKGREDRDREIVL